MTTYQQFPVSTYDDQDKNEVGVYGDVTYPGVGAIIRIRGNDTEDKEVEVAYIGGCSFKLPKDADCEITMISTGSDTTLKIAAMTPPRDKNRRWKENTGGIQHPTDPEHVLEFNTTRAHITKNAFAVGPKGTLEVKGQSAAAAATDVEPHSAQDVVYIRGRLIVEEDLVVNKLIKTPQVVSGTEQIPSLQNPAQQDQVSDSGGTQQ